MSGALPHRGGLPLLTAAEARALDAHAEGSLALPVELLMEHAGRSVADAVGPLLSSARRVLVFAGPGNKGGDGLVAARLLRGLGPPVEVVLCQPAEGLSPLAAANLARWRAATPQSATHDGLPPLGAGDLALDALLGTGLNRAPAGALADAIRHLNAARQRGARVVAIDLPSGLNPDTGRPFDPCIEADLTVTLAAKKRGLAQEPGASLAGLVRVGTIGLPDPAAALAVVKARAFELDRPWVANCFRAREAGSFKTSYGHLLVVAGSPGKAGAAALAVHGALRAGVGLCSLAAVPSVLASALVGRPEAMSVALEEQGPLTLQALPALRAALAERSALAIGPGLWRGEGTFDLLAALLAEFKGPMVLDADALNALAGRSGALAGAGGPTVVTPHPGEMARLLGTSGHEVQADRFAAAQRFAQAERTVVVLKGARTVVASPEGDLAVVPTGNPGLAHGGTGDVLCGIVGALLAQGLSAFEAGCAGAYLHGWAGDLGSRAFGQRGLLASDVADRLGAVWSELGL